MALGISDKTARVFQGMLLFYILACDTLILYRLQFIGRTPQLAEAGHERPAALPIILTIITAATPLLLAAIGELVVERSGVLNLGVEGMMVVGAVCGLRRGAD